MIGLLIRKQFREIAAALQVNKRTGQRASKGTVIFLAILFAFCYVALFAAFFGISFLFTNTMIPLDLDWLFFGLIGIAGMGISLFGSVFSTYSILYSARDNEFLLSLPVPPWKILFTRILVIYVLAFLYESVALLPAMIVYWIVKPAVTVTAVIYPLLLLFVSPLFVTAVASILGFLIAELRRFIRHRAVVITFFALLIIGIYYFVSFRINAFLDSIVANVSSLADTMETSLFPFYVFGCGMAGDTIGFLLYLLLSVCSFALVYLVLSKTFIRLITTKIGERKRKEKRSAVKERSVTRTLVHREVKHFFSSSAYMMNIGMGLILLIGFGVLFLFKRADLLTMLDGVSEALHLPLQNFLAYLPFVVIAFLTSTAPFAAPSISLEGKNFWILQSLPLSAKDVIDAKLLFSLLFLSVPATIAALIFSIGFGLSVIDVFFTVTVVLSFVGFLSAIAMSFGLKKPMFNWSSETVPIKSSSAVVFTYLLGWLVTFAVIVIDFLTFAILPAWILLLLLTIVFTLSALLLRRRILEKYAGANSFLLRAE